MSEKVQKKPFLEVLLLVLQCYIKFSSGKPDEKANYTSETVSTSLRLQQQSPGVPERLRHKLSCLGSTNTQRQGQTGSGDCGSTFWINSLVGSLSPDEW